MQKFKDWILSGTSLEIKPNAFALEVLSYFAYETVAEVGHLLRIHLYTTSFILPPPFIHFTTSIKFILPPQFTTQLIPFCHLRLSFYHLRSFIFPLWFIFVPPQTVFFWLSLSSNFDLSYNHIFSLAFRFSYFVIMKNISVASSLIIYLVLP